MGNVLKGIVFNLKREETISEIVEGLVVDPNKVPRSLDTVCSLMPSEGSSFSEITLNEEKQYFRRIESRQ